MATTVTGCPGRWWTMTYQTISQWPCTICKTQRNYFRNPQNLPKLTVMYLRCTKIKHTSARSYQKKISWIKYGIYQTFQFWGQINPKQRSELYSMHPQNVRKFPLMMFCCKVPSSKMTKYPPPLLPGVPRCSWTGSGVKKITLHTFTATSQQVYGVTTVIFKTPIWRWICQLLSGSFEIEESNFPLHVLVMVLLVSTFVSFLCRPLPFVTPASCASAPSGTLSRFISTLPSLLLLSSHN